MTQPSLTEEQEAALAELCKLSNDAEQRLREMSELADAIAQKYHNIVNSQSDRFPVN